MIDLHCHLPHGIDDGPDTLDQSVELCRIAVADGITHAITTPHIHPGRWENTRETVRLSCERLQQELDNRGIALQLGYAAEVRLTDAIPGQVAADIIPFYGEVDSYKVMLLEFPHGHVIPGSHKLVSWLLDRGIRPMIAHPERNRQIMRDPGLLRPFIDLGCWLQLTAGSVTGQFGEPAQSVAYQLLERGEVKVLASDGHNATARPPVLRAAFDQVGRDFGEDAARLLFVDAPGAIAASQFT